MKVYLRGKFRIEGADGRDLTPTGQKERAILAILALTDGHVCARQQLQRMLWSDRFEEQASDSLRRALYLLRKDAAEPCWIEADRTVVSIAGPVELVFGSPSEGPLLADIRVKDPTFLKWLHQVRYRQDGTIPAQVPAQRQEERILIVTSPLTDDAELHFVTRRFTAMLAQALREQGPVAVLVRGGSGGSEEVPDQTLWRIEVDSIRSASHWSVGLSVFRVRPQRFIWSGRLKRPFNLDAILSDMTVVDFAGCVGACIHSGDRRDTGIYQNLLTAAQKIFLGRRDELELADRILQGLEAEDQHGSIRAWRSFIGLTRKLEHGVRQKPAEEQALALAFEAEQQGIGNALATGLAAQVTLKIGQDPDRADHLARRALQFDEFNPYALHALSQVRVSRGDYLSGYKLANLARLGAQSLPHSFCWDMQACLAALGVGQRQEALDLASQANMKMPSYRPALRYLVAVSLLQGRSQEAARWADKLRALEPGFAESHLLEADYPVDTLRSIGLQDELLSMNVVDESRPM
jgi:hypothetical protein